MVAQTSDRRLTVGIGRGDRRALAALFERHFASVYDFSLQVVEDRDATGLAVEETFAQAWQQLRLGVRPQRVRAWLFALAREASLDALGGRVRAAAAPATAATNGTCVRGPLDRSLLDLHLRRGLGEEEIAEALSLAPQHVRARLSRLREEYEQEAAQLHLVHGGRAECPEADTILMTARAAHGPLPRRRLWKHARSCPACQRVLERDGATARALAAAPLAPQPAGTAAEIWERVAARSPGRDPRAVRLAVAGTVLGTAAIVAFVVGRSDDVRPAGAGVQASVSGKIASLPGTAAVGAGTDGTAPGAFLPPQAERTFAWAPSGTAVTYVFVLYRGDDPVYEAHTRTARLVLPAVWRHRGVQQSLTPATYRWVVWPVTASGQRADEAIVAARLVVG